MRKTLLQEAAIVGASTLVIGMVMQKTYDHMGWKVPQPVFWSLLGVWTHLAWEATGGNQWFCKNMILD